VETISFKLPADLRARLEREAKRRQVRQSTIIRESLERTLGRVDGAKRELTCADLAGDLIGSFAGPPDLSTNPKYLYQALAEDRARRRRKRRR
jgi:hypothetical protein